VIYIPRCAGSDFPFRTIYHLYLQENFNPGFLVLVLTGRLTWFSAEASTAKGE